MLTCSYLLLLFAICAHTPVCMTSMADPGQERLKSAHRTLHGYSNIDDVRNGIKQAFDIPRPPLPSSSSLRITFSTRSFDDGLAELMIEPIIGIRYDRTGDLYFEEYHSLTGTLRKEWPCDIPDMDSCILSIINDENKKYYCSSNTFK
jgi:hypothetical protein